MNRMLVVAISLASLGSIAVIGVALLLGASTSPLQHFKEGGLITAISAISLAMSGTLSLVILNFRRQEGLMPSLFWLGVAVGLLLLSLDELLMLHERLGQLTNSWVGEPSTTFRNWNDLVVILYGVAAIIICFVFRREIVRDRSFFILFSISFGFYALHTALDSLISASYVWKDLFEEGAKVTCGVFLVFAMAIKLLPFLTPPVLPTHHKDEVLPPT